MRAETRRRALVGDTQLCSRSSWALASPSVRPMIGMTPGNNASSPGSRPYLAMRTLRPPLHVERPAYLKIFTLVIERTHLGAIDEDTRVSVAHNSGFIPATPQPAHNVDELACNLVALVVLDMALSAKIEMGIRRTRSNDVPSNPAFGEVGQRLEHARDVEGFAEAR